MNLAERVVDGFHIYAVALPAPGGCGYLAAVVVMSCRGSPADSRRELFRDDRLEDGAVWRNAEQALEFALEVGEAAIRAQAVMRASGAVEVAA